MPSTHATGPIARKILNSVQKLKKKTVVDLAVYRQGRDEMEQLFREAVPSHDAGVQSPSFAAYTYVTNWAIGLVEALQELPELRRFMERMEKAEDEYMPSGPPMSPLTRSYYSSWLLWDMSVGVKRETLGSILLAVARSQGMDSIFVGVLALLVESRLGLHVHEGVRDDQIQLRELVTDELRACICPAGYDGVAGELWLARVLPPPSPVSSEHIVITTPYVIVDPSVDAWRRYLGRTLCKTGSREYIDAYKHLMKRGLDDRYWSEYVFEAYANHKPEAIFLRGLPDVPQSRPQSRENSGKW